MSQEIRTLEGDYVAVTLFENMSAMFACLGAGERIQIHSYFRKSFFAILLIFIGIGLNVPTTSAQQYGFLSIDCGSSQENYTDSAGLQWVTDSGQYMNLGDTIEQPSVNEVQASSSLRYFAEGRSKYCYELPTPNVSVNYLIRASFYMNQSLRNMPQFSGVQFTLSLDANVWFTVSNTIVGENLDSLSVVEEAIFYPPNQITNVCLQPLTVGSPFISSLELRILYNNPNVYAYDGDNKEYLALAFRYNLGAQSTAPNVRYPDDIFDRIWTTPDASWNHLCPNVSIPEAPSTRISPDSQYVPPKVMKNAWLFQSTGGCGNLTIPVYVSNGPVYLAPADYFHVSVYFEHLNISDTYGYTEFVFVDDNPSDVVLIGDFTSEKAFVHLSKYQALSQNYLNLQPELGPGQVVDDGPTINALELHGQYNYNFSTANSDDVKVINALKTGFSLTDWQGDPCTPVPHDWLSCSLGQPIFGNLQQPCRNDTSGSDSQCSAPHADLKTKYYVTSINVSDRTISGFSGVIGNTTFPTGPVLKSLNDMSITNSGVDNTTFLYLIDCASSELNTLDLSYNAIDYIPPASGWADLANLTFLNLSHNHLSGELSAFEDVPFVNTLQTLDLSYNAMTSVPTVWTNTSTSLVSLNLSYNQFQEDISSLDELLQINRESLTEFSISRNNVSGVISSDLYFQNLSKLRVANFDQNFIGGVLDLSVWLTALQAADDAYSRGSIQPVPNVTLQLFSFVGNNISDIVPRAESFESTIRSLINNTRGRFYESGILLGGNPYCNSPSSDIHTYFCRNSTNVRLQDPRRHKNDKLILIVGLSGGLVGLLFFTVMSTALFKMWKEVAALRGVQKELASRKVQPPLYHYSDLKSATRNFGKDNKLGQGAFGIVYKGILGDGTPIAAKKLFNNQRLKVLDDFLNEVVLITGIKHRNLVQLKGCCIEERQRMLVYEYAEKGNLADALWGSKVFGYLNWEQRLKICVGVARGLAYLHEELQPSIIHRDIKPENILLDTNFNPKIADFGLARHVIDDPSSARSTQIAGTIGYFAPEYIMRGELSEKLDVYSYGVLILEIVSGRKCIDPSLPNEEKFLTGWLTGMKKEDLLFEVLQKDLREDCVAEEVIRAIHIGLLCVQYLPERRPTMSEVVTMFLGSMDIRVVSDESDIIHKTYNNLLATIDNGTEYPQLGVIEEDSSVFPLLDLESLPSVNNSSSGSSSRPLIEMSTVYGR